MQTEELLVKRRNLLEKKIEQETERAKDFTRTKNKRGTVREPFTVNLPVMMNITLALFAQDNVLVFVVLDTNDSPAHTPDVDIQMHPRLQRLRVGCGTTLTSEPESMLVLSVHEMCTAQIDTQQCMTCLQSMLTASHISLLDK